MRWLLVTVCTAWLVLTLALGFNWLSVRELLTGGPALNVEALLNPPVWPLLTLALATAMIASSLGGGLRHVVNEVGLLAFGCGGFFRRVDGLGDVGFTTQMAGIAAFFVALLLPRRTQAPNPRPTSSSSQQPPEVPAAGEQGDAAVEGRVVAEQASSLGRGARDERAPRS